MRNLSLLLISILFINTSYAQTSDKELALVKSREGIALIDKGEIEEAIVLFEKAKMLDPENITYPYEIAYGHYLTRQYKKAIHVLEKLVDHKDVNDKIFQLLGNSYDNIGHYKKAQDAYKKGLELNPKSGDIYMELGTLEIHKKDFPKALSYFEKGIEAEPDYSSNYFWASKISCSTEDVIWGVLYGEVFINMVPGSEKSGEVSKMLVDVYKKNITSTKDTVMIGFSNVSMEGESFEKSFEQTLQKSVEKSNKEEFTLQDIVSIRINFFEKWFNDGAIDRYPNLVMDYQKKIYYAGFLEEYNYWLLSGGDPEGFFKWKNKNEARFQKFLKWHNENLPAPDYLNYFVKSLY